MLVIEHDMPLAMAISDRVYCLEAGRVIAEGSPGQIVHDDKVISSYLGIAEKSTLPTENPHRPEVVQTS